MTKTASRISSQTPRATILNHFETLSPYFDLAIRSLQLDYKMSSERAEAAKREYIEFNLGTISSLGGDGRKFKEALQLALRRC